MNSEEIKLLKKQSVIVTFTSQIDESQIVQILMNQKYHDQITIKSHLDSMKASIIGYQFNQLSQLVYLELQFIKNTLIKSEPLKIIGNNFKYLINLKFLFFTLNQQEQCKELKEGLIELGNGLKDLDSLELFSINYCEEQQLWNEVSPTVNKSLRRLKQLTNLSFQFRFSCLENSAEYLQELSFEFQYMSNLISLEIHILENNSELSHELNQVSENLKHLINLKYLDLSVKGSNYDFDNSIEVLKESLTCLKNLTHLKLDLHQSQKKILKQEFAISLLNRILQFEKLEYLDYYIYFYIEIEDKQNIGETICQNSNLNHLMIILYNQNDNLTQSQILLNENLMNLVKIKFFKLQIYKLKVDLESDKLLEWLLCDCKTIETLSMWINYDSIKTLQKSIKNYSSRSQNLKELDFTIDSLDIFQSSSDLIYPLVFLPQLIKLSLQLEKYHFTFEDTYIKQFEKLDNLQELGIMEFEFSDNQSVIQLLRNLLIPLKNLEKLDIQISSFTIHDNDEHYENCFKNLKKLKNLQIQFMMMDSTVRMDKKQASQFMKGIQNLENLIELQIWLPDNILNVITCYEFSDSLIKLNKLNYFYIDINEINYLNIVKRKNRRLVQFQKQGSLES